MTDLTNCKLLQDVQVMIHRPSTNRHTPARTSAHLDVGVLEVGVQPLGRHHGLRPGQRVVASGLRHRPDLAPAAEAPNPKQSCADEMKKGS